jgi:hypothetical protein
MTMSESVTVQASGTTGSTCKVSGPYRSTRNAGIIVFLKAGDKFPVDADGASTTWTLVSH